MKKKTLKERLIEAGYPASEMFHHGSDLYIFKTDLTIKVVQEWIQDNGWNRDLLRSPFLCTVFKDQITGQPMYDLAFQWYPD